MTLPNLLMLSLDEPTGVKPNLQRAVAAAAAVKKPKKAGTLAVDKLFKKYRYRLRQMPVERILAASRRERQQTICCSR